MANGAIIARLTNWLILLHNARQHCETRHKGRHLPLDIRWVLLLSIIAAVAENGVIGRAGQLPWRLPADLEHFRRLTWGKPILMGRLTHQSIGRALEGRKNLVLTRDAAFSAPGTRRVGSIDEGIA